MGDITKPNSNKADLHSSTYPLAIEFEILIAQRGIDAYIFETLRSTARQEYLYKQGASQIKSGGVHETGLAFDVIFHGPKPWDQSHPWAKLGQIGKDLGLYWGGLWKKFVDSPHFQFIPPNQLAQSMPAMHRFPPPPLPKLRRGDYGDTVAFLQKMLGLVQDGDYGPKTEQSVMSIQRGAALTVDGVCRWGTWKAI